MVSWPAKNCCGEVMSKRKSQSEERIEQQRQVEEKTMCPHNPDSEISRFSFSDLPCF